VVIDVRNAYESDIGRFGAQQRVGGAELLVPDMRKSTDFPSWIEREETKEKLQGRYSGQRVRCIFCQCSGELP
jgi:predicted sulfurtransferase